MRFVEMLTLQRAWTDLTYEEFFSEDPSSALEDATDEQGGKPLAEPYTVRPEVPRTGAGDSPRRLVAGLRLQLWTVGVIGLRSYRRPFTSCTSPQSTPRASWCWRTASALGASSRQYTLPSVLW